MQHLHEKYRHFFIPHPVFRHGVSWLICGGGEGILPQHQRRSFFQRQKNRSKIKTGYLDFRFCTPAPFSVSSCTFLIVQGILYLLKDLFRTIVWGYFPQPQLHFGLYSKMFFCLGKLTGKSPRDRPNRSMEPVENRSSRRVELTTEQRHYWLYQTADNAKHTETRMGQVIVRNLQNFCTIRAWTRKS